MTGTGPADLRREVAVILADPAMQDPDGMIAHRGADALIAAAEDAQAPKPERALARAALEIARMRLRLQGVFPDGTVPPRVTHGSVVRALNRRMP